MHTVPKMERNAYLRTALSAQVRSLFRRRWVRRRPVLFILVYMVCLVLVIVTAIAQATVITVNFQTTTMDAIIANDAALVRSVVNSFVKAADLAPSGPAANRATELGIELEAMVSRAGIARAELRSVDGRVIASDLPIQPGAVATLDAGMASAVRGQPFESLVAPTQAGQTGPALIQASLLREDLPIAAQDGTVSAVLTLWRDAGPIVADVERARAEVVVLTLTAAVILSGVLYFVFRAAQDRIRRQTDALIDATRRDAVTGMLNHGALVDNLAAAMEEARDAAGTVAVALVDIDNFRLLNETNGHLTGDEALLTVAACLRARLPVSAVVGRYGPDEFLLVATGAAVAALEPAIEAVRGDLARTSIEQDTSERLPITISAGICAYPSDSNNVTDLLAIAARTLSEAKASGGDAIRHARPNETEADARGFDVLKGLVVAIDTKDRYTKRHSEDVARYALFIADRLGLDAEMHRILRLAGLLHDVGKIGIPDQILRKPGKLTDAEYDVVKQHVALGDLIVRDLPEVEHVRAGIRHHHERWDGRGYLHGLAGDDIPLVARILAVGDAFSAMTTTRPYRKALAITEAFRRLEDAAGTQLDEVIVRAFVDGLETAEDPPLPGFPSTILWTSSPTALDSVAPPATPAPPRAAAA